jgi:hypothetical protein
MTGEQLRVNEELRDERRKEYASRVSWWQDVDTRGRSLYLQNRSTVPITDVVLRYRAWMTDSPGDRVH